MPKKKTKEEFIKEADIIHNYKYNYSKVNYINNKTKVCIICPEHGEFWQTPANHLKGANCPKCGCVLRIKNNTKSFKWFLKKANEIHHNKYKYDSTNYINTSTPIIIACPKHGDFVQKPCWHLKGDGCPKCAGNYVLSTEEFIEKAKKIHGNKYDYSKVKYIKSKEKICIICPEHGEFWQTPNEHLMGNGCKKCGYKKISNKVSLTTQVFIERAKKIHGDKYDYSKVKYVSTRVPIAIICKKHGIFYQKPNYHLSGCGCPFCNKSKLEEEMKEFLEEKKISFIYQFRNNFLGKQSLDFYLPDYNIGIECQGRQHFEPIDFGGKGEKWAEKQLIESKERDNKKFELCKKQGIKLIYYLNNSKYFGNYTNEIHSPIEIKKFI